MNPLFTILYHFVYSLTCESLTLLGSRRMLFSHLGPFTLYHLCTEVHFPRLLTVYHFCTSYRTLPLFILFYLYLYSVTCLNILHRLFYCRLLIVCTLSTCLYVSPFSTLTGALRSHASVIVYTYLFT